jgi:hypothetical protein
MKRIEVLFEYVLFPLMLIVQFFSRQHAKKALGVLLFVGLPFSAHADNSCDGEEVSALMNATTDASASYSVNDPERRWENQNGKSYYYKFKTATSGKTTFSFNHTSGLKHAMRIGTSCGNNDLYDSRAKTSASKTLNTQANTLYYIQMQEKNRNNDLKFDLSFDFIANKADLRIIEKTPPSPNPVNAGSNVTFQLRTQNKGPNTATNNIVVKIKYNQDVTISSVSTTSDFTCDISSGSLSAGSYLTCTKTNNWSGIAIHKDFTIVVQPTASGTLTQTATIESTTTADPDTSNNQIDSSVTVKATNQPPVAEAGADRNVMPGDDVTLDGSGSHDDGGIVSYEWSVNGHTYNGVSPTISAADLHTGDNIVTLTVRDGAGLSDTDTMTIHVLEIVENADDLCYDDIVTGCDISVPIVGCPCMDIGPCGGGLTCRKGYPLRNIGDSELTNVIADYNTTGMGGSFGSSCGVDGNPNDGSLNGTDGGSCSDASNIDFGPFGFMGSSTHFSVTDPLDPENNSTTIWVKNFMSGSCFNGENLYGSYIKDGKLHRGRIYPCDTPPPDCAKPHVFEERVNKIVNGDLIAIGNSNICADNNEDGVCDTNQRKRNDIGNGGNNIIFINSQSSTAVASEPSELNNTTSARLQLPEGAEIVWAGLYWQGEVWDFNTSNTRRRNHGRTIENGEDGQRRKEAADTIKFKIPGGTYQELTADEHYYIYVARKTTGNKDDYSGIIRKEEHYQSFKDVTSLLQGLDNPNGDYWVADIQATPGRLHFPGVEAGWTLQVIYRYPDAKLKNISIHDGYVALYGNATPGDEYADAVGCPTGSANTGVYGRSVEFDVSGFLTPKHAGFTTDLSLFLTESDPDTNNRPNERLTISKSDGSTTLVDGPNAWQYEITDKNGSNNLNRTPHYIYPIGMTIKNYRLTDALDPDQTSTHVHFKTGPDRLLIGVIGFSTKLRAPDLCYDYAYQQDGRYFTEENNGSQSPRIVGSLVSNNPINVSLYIRNEENSDVTITNMRTTIDPIDTTQASYIDGSVKVVPPGTTIPQAGHPESSSESSIVRVPIGDGNIGGKDFFYFYYDLQPNEFTIDMPINAYLDYDTVFTLPGGGSITLPSYHQKIDTDIPFCADDNETYDPVYGIFNVQEKQLSKYNLHTQVVKRPDDFKVTAFRANSLHTPHALSTIVGVEVIDAGAFHETQTSCQQPSSALTPRAWVIFDNQSATDFTKETLQTIINQGRLSEQILGQATTIENPEDFYAKARQNAAFRIVANRLGNGDELVHLRPGTCQGNQTGPCFEVTNFPDLNRLDVGAGPGNCAQDIDGNPNNQDKIPRYCGNAGTRGLDATELATCMECIYGYNITYICSRDNFAIRPEAFRISLADDNTSTLRVDFANNTDKSGTPTDPVALVAGYPYRIDVNATNYHNDGTPVSGYVQRFDTNSSDKWASMLWHPNRSVTNCNQPADRNISVRLVNGTNTNPNPINTWDDRHVSGNNVGEYLLSIFDREWTRYDWDPQRLRHHNNAHFNGPSDADCIVDNDDVSAPNGRDKVGCEIRSVHSGTYQTYNRLYVRMYPYTFDIAGLHAGARPSNDGTAQTFVYRHTLDPNDDRNMSYNIQGTVRAAGYDSGTPALSNFVDGCYAQDLNMTLNYTYLLGDTSTQLRYDLFDSSVPNFTRDNDFLGDDSIVTQPAAAFVPDQNGSVTMDLGFNMDRTYSDPINPQLLAMHKFDIALASAPAQIHCEGVSNHQPKGSLTLDQNVSFVYGRAKPNRFCYDDIAENNVTTPVSITVFCDLNITQCTDRGLDTLFSGPIAEAQSNEAYWYFAQNHGAQDGVVALQATGGTVTPSSVTPLLGIDTSITVTNTGDTPNVVRVNFAGATSPWLIYNKDADVVPAPFYCVRFIGNGNWTGTGKTGHVVGNDVHKKKSHRTEW